MTFTKASSWFWLVPSYVHWPSFLHSIHPHLTLPCSLTTSLLQHKHHKGFIPSLTQHRITSITNILDAQHSLFNEHTSVELILLRHLGIEDVPHKLFKKLDSPLNIQAPVFSSTALGMITAVKGQRMVSFHSHRCVCAFSESNSKLTVLKNELVGMSYSQLPYSLYFWWVLCAARPLGSGFSFWPG